MRTKRGSATLVVLTLLALMSLTIILNGHVLAQLRVELGRIDRQQQAHFKSP